MIEEIHIAKKASVRSVFRRFLRGYDRMKSGAYDFEYTQFI